MELLQALESDLELVGRKERGRVVEEFNPKERDDRHGEFKAKRVDLVNDRAREIGGRNRRKGKPG